MSDNAAERTAGRQVGLVSGQGRTDIPGLSGRVIERNAQATW